MHRKSIKEINNSSESSERKAPGKVFAISASGCCASMWISEVLTLHPKIHCWHANDTIPNSHTFNHQQDLLRELLRQNRVTGLINGTIHFFPFYGTTLLPYMEAVSGGFSAIIRSPIKRIQSCISVKSKRYDPTSYMPQLKMINSYMNNHYLSSSGVKHSSSDAKNLVEACINKLGRNLTFYEMEFLASTVKHLFFDHQNVTLPPEKLFKFEEIVKERDVFCRLFVEVTKGCLDLEDHYVELVFKHGVVNRHSNSNVQLTAEEIYYQVWTIALRSIFDSVVSCFTHPILIEKYLALGYWLPDHLVSGRDLASVHLDHLEKV